MKIKHFFHSLILVIMLIQCAVQKKTTYDLPGDLTPERETELLANLEKGKILYKTYCSSCHGIFTKGKDGIPNFTEKEIVSYMTAYQNNDEKNHAVIKQLLPEELSMIMTFLRLRKFKGKADH
jgi:cytochrome c553